MQRVKGELADDFGDDAVDRFWYDYHAGEPRQELQAEEVKWEPRKK